MAGRVWAHLLILAMRSWRFVSRGDIFGVARALARPPLLAQVRRRVGVQGGRRPPRPACRKGGRGGRTGRNGRAGGRIVEAGCAPAYLGLVAQAVAAVDPDVLGETFTSLVKGHVLGELCALESAGATGRRGPGDAHIVRVGHDGRVTDSRLPKCVSTALQHLGRSWGLTMMGCGASDASRDWDL
jgi:hypothetical protein